MLGLKSTEQLEFKMQAVLKGAASDNTSSNTRGK